MYDFTEAASENSTFYADLTNPQSLNKYQYTYNNPINLTDEDGHCPPCAAAAAAALEVGGTALDLYETYKTLRDPKASTTEKVVTTLGTGAGLLIPGVAGLGAGGKAIIKQVAKVADDAVDAGKAVNKADKAVDATKAASRSDNVTKQERLREIGQDQKASSSDRGWIKQETNQIDRGSRSNIRVPPGKQLAHERGRERAKGYSYKHSNLQDQKLHRTQHKYDNFGRKNKERPVR